MGGGVESGASSGAAVNAFENRANRAFAIRAGDVDKAEFILRIPHRSCETPRRLQTWLKAKLLERMQVFEGLSEGHSPSFWQGRANARDISDSERGLLKRVASI